MKPQRILAAGALFAASAGASRHCRNFSQMYPAANSSNINTKIKLKR